MKASQLRSGTDIDVDDIPDYLRELADAVEHNEIYVTSIGDRKRARADEPIEREHRLTYTTDEKGIDLFNTALITLLDEDVDDPEVVEDEDDG